MLFDSQEETDVVADGDNRQQAPLVSWRAAALALLLAAALAFASLWTAGSGEQNLSVWDTCFWLNSGWRILHGQVPHTDFSLTTGTFLAYLTALGMKLKGPCVGGIAAGQAVLGALLAAASFFMLRRRTTPGLALAAALFCAALVMATRQAGEAYDVRSHAFLYNRIAEGLLSVFAWILLVPPRNARGAEPALDHGAAGALLTLLALTKFSYGLAAGVVMGFALLSGLRPRSLLPLALGAALTAAALHALLGLNAGDWLRDITAPFRLGYEDSQLRRLLGSAAKGAPALLVFAGLWALLRTALTRAQGARVALALFGLWGLSVLIAFASQQRQHYAFAVAVALGVLMAIHRRVAGRRPEKRWAAVLLAILWAPQFLGDAASLASSWGSARRPPPPGTAFAAHALADFRLSAKRKSVADQINDGLALVRAHAPAGARIQGLDYSDAFSFGLQRPPPRGGAAFWYPGFNFSEAHHPPPEFVFQDRPWVLMAQGDSHRIPFMRCYGPWLAQHYTPVAESRHYRLWAPQPQE